MNRKPKPERIVSNPSLKLKEFFQVHCETSIHRRSQTVSLMNVRMEMLASQTSRKICYFILLYLCLCACTGFHRGQKVDIGSLGAGVQVFVRRPTVGAGIWTPGSKHSATSPALTLFFGVGLSLPYNSLSKPGWLVSEPQGQPVSASLALDCKCPAHAWLCTWALELRLSS